MAALAPALLERIDREVAQREAWALDLLRALIRTPSVSGDEGRADRPNTVAGLLSGALAGEGIATHPDPVGPDRDNIVAVVSGDAAGPIVVLDAHTDTVPPGAAERWLDGNPFSARDGIVTYLGNDRVRLEVGELAIEQPVRRRLGRLWEARGHRSAPAIYGRGSFDNKGPVAVALLATVAVAGLLRSLGLRLGGSLVCALTVDEEQGMAGTKSLAGGPGCWLDRNGLLPSRFGPDGWRDGIVGVALDGSYGFVPVVGHRGVAQLVVRTTGQAAHAATPDLGTNAVTRMAAVLHALEQHAGDLDRRLAPLFADALLEPATLALGTTIAGGGVRAVVRDGPRPKVERAGINVVPDWCEATIDCRHPRAADGDQATIQERIAGIVRAVGLERTGLPADDLTVDPLGGNPPCAIVASAEGAERDPLVGAVLRHGEAVSGFRPWVETAPGGTDATVMINEGRIKTLVEFGPAGAFAHEPHEFVEPDQIAVGGAILARVIVELLGIQPATA